MGLLPDYRREAAGICHPVRNFLGGEIVLECLPVIGCGSY